jgi:phosphoribosyl 1,2-cyclic phosphodiesterase
MRVTFYGVRGSLPSPGPGTVRYGGNTSCVELRLCDGTVLVLDGGTGLRELGRALVEERAPGPIHLLVTHVHWDHIMGIPFFAPVYRRDTTVVVHPLTVGGAMRTLGNEELFDGKHFPLRLHQLPSTLVRPQPPPEPSDQPWEIGSARITRVPLNHPGGSTGFRIDDADGASVAFLTDNELEPPGTKVVSSGELARFARGAGLLIHDAQYVEEDLPDKLGWGHSTVQQVLQLAQAAEVRCLALYHHDPDRTDDALDGVAREAQAWWREHVQAGRVLVAAERLRLDVSPG